MRDTKRNRSRRVRTFQLGDKVRLFKPSKSKLARKVGRVYEGPYTVMDVIRHANIPSEYVLKRDGSAAESRVRATAEVLRVYLEAAAPSSLQTLEEVQELVAKAPKRQYEVKAILGERGSTRHGTKAYLVDWGEEWEPTWQPLELIRAPEKVSEFHAKKHTRRSTGSSVANPVAVVGSVRGGRVVSLKMDVMKHGPAETWSRILTAAGVQWEELLLVWASPPCQTFSPADYSNISRGHAYRDHTDPC